MKTKHAIALTLLSGLLISCATHEPVRSASITHALDLKKTNRFAVEIVDTNTNDTAFSRDMQSVASSALIRDLESNGFVYVGERNPEIRLMFRTYASDEPVYLDTTGPGEVRVRVTEEVTTPGRGRTETTTRTETISRDRSPEPIHLAGNTRIFLLDVVDTRTDTLLWRGQTHRKDTSLSQEKLIGAIDELTDRLENDT